MKAQMVTVHSCESSLYATPLADPILDAREEREVCSVLRRPSHCYTPKGQQGPCFRILLQGSDRQTQTLLEEASVIPCVECCPGFAAAGDGGVVVRVAPHTQSEKRGGRVKRLVARSLCDWPRQTRTHVAERESAWTTDRRRTPFFGTKGERPSEFRQ